MAQVTDLSLSATPGPVRTFVAKVADIIGAGEFGLQYNAIGRIPHYNAQDRKPEYTAPDRKPEYSARPRP